MDLREQSYGKAGYQPSGTTDTLFPGTFYLAEVRESGDRSQDPERGRRLPIHRKRSGLLPSRPVLLYAFCQAFSRSKVPPAGCPGGCPRLATLDCFHSTIFHTPCSCADFVHTCGCMFVCVFLKHIYLSHPPSPFDLT